MSTYEDDINNDSDNNLGDDFDYKPNAHHDVEDDDVDSLDFTSKSEHDCCIGFVMRKDDVVRDKKCKIICRQLICNKEGYRNMRYLDLDNRLREARSLTRTKCPARLKVKVDYGYGRWKISCFVESHNHDLTPPFADLVPANRHLTITDKVQVENLHNFGVKTCHIMGYIVFQKGGYHHAGFTRKNLYNHIDRYRRSKVKNKDANAAIR
ncbi:protein FAR1-RELATED SEQUENCE 5-like [Arachis duranensis]|uniref:Protein FAR1-RELATED SEQUENCE 5-like n=1 Tax=Arachis duranensis TaxID=130453 RepID=A0A6P4CE57_ARADU|nr:protein FAR1-RELATED SEQUENCE 5-like [Arachis duranensis]